MFDSLKTTQFKEIYNLSKTWPFWCRHLLLGLLVGIEGWWIDKKVTQEVSDAIKKVEPYLPPSGVPDPVYSDTGDGFFDEMRLTAPWKAQEDPSDHPQV